MNLGMLEIMLPAFAECVVLVGIHSYLGIHVIKRKVIFVDLALAQIAALGITVAFLFGVDPSSQGAYWFSFGFTVIGAAIFSISRLRQDKIPQEAVIGLVYALAAAIAILVIDRAPHGAEHIKEIMTGNILWVRWETIGLAAVVYLAVGFFHYLFRDKFLLISNNPALAYKQKMNVRFWDFLFYVSFGVVITHSVNTAGVLLVFVFLVVPAIASMMLTDKLTHQLLIGWSMGFVVSGLGLFISYIGDLPSGPAVASTYGLILVLFALVVYVVRSEKKLPALRNIGIGLLLIVAFYGIFRGMGAYFTRQMAHHEKPAAHSPDQHGPGNGNISDRPISPAEYERAFTEAQTVSELELLYNTTTNEIHKIEILGKLIKMDESVGSRLIIDLLESGAVPFVKEEAVSILRSISNQNFGYNSSQSVEQNIEALQKMRSWRQAKFGD